MKKGIKNYWWIGLLLMLLVFLLPADQARAASYSWMDVDASVSRDYTVTLKWKKKSVDYYEIYRAAIDSKTGETGKYVKLGKIDGDKKSFKDQKAAKKQTAAYRVIAYKGGKKRYYWENEIYLGLGTCYPGEYSFVEAEISPKKITLVICYDGYMQVDGYQIYRKKAGDSEYKKIKTIKTQDYGFEYVDTKVTAGASYTYKIRAFITNNGKYEYGKFSERIGRKAVNMPGKYKVTRIKDEGLEEGTFEYKIVSRKYNGILNLSASSSFEYASEDDVSYYIIQYSQDGINWKKMKKNSCKITAGETLYIIIRVRSEYDPKINSLEPLDCTYENIPSFFNLPGGGVWYNGDAIH